MYVTGVHFADEAMIVSLGAGTMRVPWDQLPEKLRYTSAAYRASWRLVADSDLTQQWIYWPDLDVLISVTEIARDHADAR